MSDRFDQDELMKNQDFEDEFFLSEKMTELMLENECKKEDPNSRNRRNCRWEDGGKRNSWKNGQIKVQKQFQMTDFLLWKKNKLKLKMLILFKNCSCPL